MRSLALDDAAQIRHVGGGVSTVGDRAFGVSGAGAGAVIGLGVGVCDRSRRERKATPDRILDLLFDLRRRDPRERTRIELSALKQRPRDIVTPSLTSLRGIAGKATVARHARRD